MHEPICHHVCESCMYVFGTCDPAASPMAIGQQIWQTYNTSFDVVYMHNSLLVI